VNGWPAPPAGPHHRVGLDTERAADIVGVDPASAREGPAEPVDHGLFADADRDGRYRYQPLVRVFVRTR
jgi:hypothetical protein